MASGYDSIRDRQPGAEDLAGVVVLVGCAVVGLLWYVAVSRLHFRNSQCLEIFLDVSVLLFGSFLGLSHFIGRREKREQSWPHPSIHIKAAKDAQIVASANRDTATLLGYNVHKEPFLWPDSVRTKHGVIAGGTGSGKTTFLKNVIIQDLSRTFD